MARIKTFSMMKDADVRLGKNFAVRDFACKDGSDHVEIDLDLIDLLQEIRSGLGNPRMIITSGYRTVSHNASKYVQGDPQSLHLSGQAADIVVPGMPTAHIAAYAEMIGAPGILRYITKNFVHIDTGKSKNYAEYINGIRYDVPTHGAIPSYRLIGVTAIQKRMSSLYGTGLDVDGIYGPQTKRALLIGLQTELNRRYHAHLNVDGHWRLAVRRK